MVEHRRGRGIRDVSAHFLHQGCNWAKTMVYYANSACHGYHGGMQISCHGYLKSNITAIGKERKLLWRSIASVGSRAIVPNI